MIKHEQIDRKLNAGLSRTELKEIFPHADQAVPMAARVLLDGLVKSPPGHWDDEDPDGWHPSDVWRASCCRQFEDCVDDAHDLINHCSCQGHIQQLWNEGSRRVHDEIRDVAAHGFRMLAKLVQPSPAESLRIRVTLEYGDRCDCSFPPEWPDHSTYPDYPEHEELVDFGCELQRDSMGKWWDLDVGREPSDEEIWTIWRELRELPGMVADNSRLRRIEQFFTTGTAYIIEMPDIPRSWPDLCMHDVMQDLTDREWDELEDCRWEFVDGFDVSDEMFDAVANLLAHFHPNIDWSIEVDDTVLPRASWHIIHVEGPISDDDVNDLNTTLEQVLDDICTDCFADYVAAWRQDIPDETDLL